MKKLLILITLSVFSHSVADDAQDAATLRRQAAAQAHITAPQKIQTGQQISSVSNLIALIKQFFLDLIAKLKALFGNKTDVLKNLDKVTQEVNDKLTPEAITTESQLNDTINDLHTTIVESSSALEDKVAILTQEDEEFAKVLDQLDPDLAEKILTFLEGDVESIKQSPNFKELETTTQGYVDQLSDRIQTKAQQLDLKRQELALERQGASDQIDLLKDISTNLDSIVKAQIDKALALESQVSQDFQDIQDNIMAEVEQQYGKRDGWNEIKNIIENKVKDLASEKNINQIKMQKSESSQQINDERVVADIAKILNSSSFEQDLAKQIETIISTNTKNLSSINDAQIISAFMQKEIEDTIRSAISSENLKALQLNLSPSAQQKINDLFVAKLNDILEKNNNRAITEKVKELLPQLETEIISVLEEPIEIKTPTQDIPSERTRIANDQPRFLQDVTNLPSGTLTSTKTSLQTTPVNSTVLSQLRVQGGNRGGINIDEETESKLNSAGLTNTQINLIEKLPVDNIYIVYNKPIMKMNNNDFYTFEQGSLAQITNPKSLPADLKPIASAPGKSSILSQTTSTKPTGPEESGRGERIAELGRGLIETIPTIPQQQQSFHSFE